VRSFFGVVVYRDFSLGELVHNGDGHVRDAVGVPEAPVGTVAAFVVERGFAIGISLGLYLDLQYEFVHDRDAFGFIRRAQPHVGFVNSVVQICREIVWPARRGQARKWTRQSSGRTRQCDPRLSRQQTGKSAEHRRFPNPQGRLPATEKLKLGSRLKLFGCIHSGGGSNTLSLPCLVAGQDRALDGGNGCVCVLEPMGAAAQNTAILCRGASKISLQIRTTEFTNPTANRPGARAARFGLA
jgi:hypothetical protein